jgi:hypothetical protein
MKKPIVILICILSLLSCNAKRSNQTVDKKREGLWIERYSIDSAHYKSIGKYNNNNPVKKWRYYLNDKLIKKEKYRSKGCKTKFYHQNRRTQAKGRTKIEEEKQLHWYYSGTWKYYDNKGKLKTTREYRKGDLISEENNKKK